ncbi:Alpha/beta hydrolase fold-1 [Armillaria novae-zelandiae]|uniref:Alpha/beta hydrolase fold-1 n=1 Tax=Armillaria novae-zelandiae TaxID=153914 RepID=A0AA39PTR9_9AGAR|nr:Alpha/beta hydrolase fold-1 [Armillaria novae-zelandiae]
MSFSAFIVEAVVLKTACIVNGVPLKMAAKRYVPTASTNKDGKALIFLHATGTHKEHWEPVIAKIFSSTEGVKECWAFDSLSHGESALLNATEIASFSPSISDWARGVAELVENRLQGERIVIVGHSAGASAAMFSTKCYSSGTPPYESIILVEPPLIDRHVFQANIKDRERQTAMLTKAVAAQRSTWNNRKAAFDYLVKRAPWKTWDIRIVVIQANYGLRPLDPERSLESVTTKCDKRHEAGSFTDFESTFDATEQIEKVCATVPVHVIYGKKDSLVCVIEHSRCPQYSQDSLSDISKGRRLASVARISSGGHLLVQEDPDAVSAKILSILNQPHRDDVTPKL